MKKSIFLAAMLLLVSFAMAQNNTATTTQNGPDNLATVDQSGADNGSVVLQESATFPPRGMTADIDQIGANNTSDVYQGKFGQHYATVNQGGTSNNAKVVSLRNNETANILQDGENNDAYQRLHGNLGETTIEQIGNDNMSNQNIGIYGTAGINNKFTGYQTGDNNSLTQTLSTDYDFVSAGNVGTIMQVGHNNTSTQSIGTTSSFSSDNTAEVNIKGNDNLTEQTLIGDGNNAAIRQQGNSNIANQYAFGDGNDLQTVVAGSDNNIDQDANGNDNFSYLAASHNTSRNAMKSDQWGDKNYVNSRIYGTNADGSSDNRLYIMQDGTGNRSTNKVDGNNNEIDISQTGEGNIAGTNNVNWGVIQIGDLNQATITQDGDLNIGSISQTGDSNFGSITSTGTGHSGIITQTGGMNQALITQN